MKRINLVLLTLGILSAGFFNSCNTDEEEPTPPTIIITEQAGATYAPGTSVDFLLDISSNEELVSFWVDESIVSNPFGEIVAMDPAEVLVIEDWTFDNNIHSAKLTYRYNIPETGVAAGSVVKLDFEIEDKETTGTNSIEFTVVSGAGSIQSYTAVLLGAHEATTGSFYATSTNTVYTVSDAAANQAAVDFVYYFGASNQATVASPDDSGAAEFAIFGLDSWTTKNATRFATTTLSSLDFDAIVDDAAILVQAGNVSDMTKANMLVVDDVFAFTTAAGKAGLVKVSDVTTGTDGSITLQVKVQE